LNPASEREKRRQKYVPLPPHYRRQATLASHDSVSTLSKLRGDYLKCNRCGKFIPASEAKVSGFDSQTGLSHIRCPNCGRIITHTPGKRSKKDVAKGIGIAAAGVATAVVGGPLAGVFAMQAGTFLSLYGSLTALMSPDKKKKKAEHPSRKEKKKKEHTTRTKFVVDG
jgi:DNA-directed RNA polymerase subunit RPC12/RpoP